MRHVLWIPAAGASRLSRLPSIRRWPILVLVGAAVAGGAVAAASALQSGRPGWARDVLVRAPTRQRVVALTFDDGPDPRWTPSVLRLLRVYHAHATFFLLGRMVAAHPMLARAEVAAGNDLGNHTYSHADLIWLRPAAIASELERTDAAFGRAGLPRPRFFRPPFGLTDQRVERVATALGYCTVLWAVGVERYGDQMPVPRALRLLLRRIRPGVIILAHDAGPTRWWTLAALPRLLSGLEARGYEIVDLSQLLHRVRTATCELTGTPPGT